MRTLSFTLSLVFLLSAVRGYVVDDEKTNVVSMNEEKAIATSAVQNLDFKDNIYWRHIGAEALSDPCCVATSPDRVDCFVRGPGSNVLQRTISKVEGEYEYSDWNDLKGVIINEIECLSRDEGIIEVFVLGTNNALYIKTYTAATGWSNWVSKGGILIEVPSCVARDANTVNCMLRGAGNGGYHIGGVKGAYSGYGSMGGRLRFPIGCSSRRQDRLNCFGAGMDNVLYHKYWTGVWGGWKKLDGLIKSRPCITAWDENRLDVFAIGMNDALYQKVWAEGWKPWVSVGGEFDSMPHCVTTGVNKIHCFGVGKGSYFIRNYYDGTNWSGWVHEFVGFTAYRGTPSCVVTGPDAVSCFVRDHARRIVHIAYDFS